MTQPKPQTSTASTPYKKSTSHVLLKIIVLAALVAIAVIAYLVYHNHQLKEQAYQADKARFAQIESDMKAAYSAMTAAAGVPDVSKYDKGCGRPNQKYSQGNLSCGVTYTYAYAEKSINTSRSRAIDMQSAVVSSGLLRLTSQKNANDIKADSGMMQTLSFGYSMSSQPCTLVYTYDSPAHYEESKTLSAEKITLYQFSCSRDVDKAVY